MLSSRLKKLIETYKDFPEKGILFRDFLPVFAEPLIYSELIESMASAGWDIPSPAATMFAWAPLPPAFGHLGSVEFSKILLSEAKMAVSPGLAFGEHGDGHVRISLVENKQRIRQAARNAKAFLSSSYDSLESHKGRRVFVS